jgi:hypothetical protein
MTKEVFYTLWGQQLDRSDWQGQALTALRRVFRGVGIIMIKSDWLYEIVVMAIDRWLKEWHGFNLKPVRLGHIFRCISQSETCLLDRSPRCDCAKKVHDFAEAKAVLPPVNRFANQHIKYACEEYLF